MAIKKWHKETWIGFDGHFVFFLSVRKLKVANFVYVDVSRIVKLQGKVVCESV